MRNEKFQGFFAVFFEIITEFSDIVNSEDCIGKKTSESIKLQPVSV